MLPPRPSLSGGLASARGHPRPRVEIRRGGRPLPVGRGSTQFLNGAEAEKEVRSRNPQFVGGVGAALIAAVPRKDRARPDDRARPQVEEGARARPASPRARRRRPRASQARRGATGSAPVRYPRPDRPPAGGAPRRGARRSRRATRRSDRTRSGEPGSPTTCATRVWTDAMSTATCGTSARAPPPRQSRRQTPPALPPRPRRGHPALA